MRPERPIPPQARSILGQDTKRMVGKEAGGRRRKGGLMILIQELEGAPSVGERCSGARQRETRRRHENIDDDDEIEVLKAEQAIEQEAVVERQSKSPAQTTKMKDLFASKDQEGSFHFPCHLSFGHC